MRILEYRQNRPDDGHCACELGCVAGVFVKPEDKRQSGYQFTPAQGQVDGQPLLSPKELGTIGLLGMIKMVFDQRRLFACSGTDEIIDDKVPFSSRKASQDQYNELFGDSQPGSFRSFQKPVISAIVFLMSDLQECPGDMAGIGDDSAEQKFGEGGSQTNRDSLDDEIDPEEEEFLVRECRHGVTPCS